MWLGKEVMKKVLVPVWLGAEVMDFFPFFSEHEDWRGGDRKEVKEIKGDGRKK